MQEKEFYYKGKKLFYRTKGSGPLVVLLHGFGEDGTVWKAQYDIFPDCQLVIPDLPGSGRSEMIEDMSMEGMAEAIRALLAPLPPKGGLSDTQPVPFGESMEKFESLQSGPTPLGKTPPLEGSGEARFGLILIGHSMGGYIALAYAEKYSDGLNGIGLFHSTAYADSDEKKQIRTKGMDVINRQGSYEFLKTTIPALFADSTKEKQPGLIEEQIAASCNFSGEALVSYYKAMMERPDRTSVLKNSEVPVLFVMGRWDKAVPLEDGLRLCHLPQLSYIHILESSGHMGMKEEAEEVNKILAQFITAVNR